MAQQRRPSGRPAGRPAARPVSKPAPSIEVTEIPNFGDLDLPPPLEGEDAADADTETLTQDEALAGLSAIATSLAQAAAGAKAKRGQTRQIMDQIAALFEKVDPKDIVEISQHPAVEKLLNTVEQQVTASGEVAPGTWMPGGLGGVLTPWQWRHIQPPEKVDPNWRPGSPQPKNTMPWVDFVPPESISVTWNGLRYQFFADVPVRCPKCFVDIYLESRNQTRQADLHKQYLFHDPLKPGQVPSDPTIISEVSHRIRATPGTYQGGRGTRGVTRTGEEAAGETQDVPEPAGTAAG